MRGKLVSIDYDLNVVYAWNKVDKSAFLPSAKLFYALNSNQKPFIEIIRSRRQPDLNLLYFNDSASGLGVGTLLNSYSFISNPDLKMPVTTQATFGVESSWGQVKSIEGISYKKIKSQIYLTYASDSVGNFTVTPTNFDDNFMEIFARASADYGPLTGEVSGAYRKWSKRFFSDNLEKGPAALAYARLSYLKQVFIPRLYLGASLEARVSSRRDYRSITKGFTGSFSSLSGRLEFRYKDLTIWLNDENLLNSSYSTWWPYLESPRIVWVGFMWNFFN